jgi:hypothetical protein
MEEWNLAVPFMGSVWEIPAGVDATITLTASAPLGDAGTVIVQPGGTLRLVYAEGVRTDPARPPRTVSTAGSILAFFVAEISESDGPLYRIAINRTGG